MKENAIKDNTIFKIKLYSNTKSIFLRASTPNLMVLDGSEDMITSTYNKVYGNRVLSSPNIITYSRVLGTTVGMRILKSGSQDKQAVLLKIILDKDIIPKISKRLSLNSN